MFTRLLFLFALLVLTGCGTIDRKFHNPLLEGEPGAHYAQGPVDYETNRVIYMRGAIRETSTGHFLTKRSRWRVEHPELMYVKTNKGEFFSQDEITAMALAPLTQPVFDNAERRQLTHLGLGYSLDLGSSAICLGVGASEAGPVAAAAPVAGLGILALHYYLTKQEMKATPLYFSVASRRTFGSKMTDFDAVEHGAVGVHNLLTCL
jgi:hypothetical protein